MTARAQYFRDWQALSRPFIKYRSGVAGTLEQGSEFGAGHEARAETGQMRRYDLAIENLKFVANEKLA